MRTTCRCGDQAIWREEPLGTTHRYRVECPHCKAFTKWGSEANLQADRMAGNNPVIIPYVEPEPWVDPFAAFMVE
jgi:hypothetical protein